MAYFDKIAAKLGLRAENSVNETTDVKQKELKQAEQTDKELQEGLNGGELLGVGDNVEFKTKDNVLKKAGKYVADWWTDKDKVSKDGADDGKISAGEYAESYAKGLVGGLAKSFKDKPVKTAATVLAVGVGCTLAAVGVVAAGIVSAPVTAVAAVIGGVVGLGFAVAGFISHGKQSHKATTDGEKKAAAEGLGTDTALAALSFLGLKGGVKGLKSAKMKSNAETVSNAEIEVKSASEAKPANEMQNAAPKYSQEEIRAFNERKGVTSERIERRYTRKLEQVSGKDGFERSISGEPGFETETFINTKPKDAFFGDRFSKYEYKYADGRRTQCDMYNEWGKPAYKEFYEYNSDGRLTQVKLAEFDQVKNEFGKPQVSHRFEYDNGGKLIKAEHPDMLETFEYEYSPEGRLAREIKKGKYVENQVVDITTYNDDGSYSIKMKYSNRQKVEIKHYNSDNHYIFTEFVDE